MTRIAKTPEPPYYAVIAPADLATNTSGYHELAQELIAIAQTIPGFIGIEGAIEESFGLAVSYWQSTEAIQLWRRHTQHVAAKTRGKRDWFTHYKTRIAKVERDY